jgi:branched-subunit amino acid transport protein AzlD
MRNLYFLLGSRFLGGLGFQILVLSSLYQIFTQTRSAGMAGLTGLILFLPIVLLTLILGQWADRIHFKSTTYLVLQVAIFILGALTLATNVMTSSILIFSVLMMNSVLRALRTPLFYKLIAVCAEEVVIRHPGHLSRGRLAQLSTLSWQCPLILGPLLFSATEERWGPHGAAMVILGCFGLAAGLCVPLLSLEGVTLQNVNSGTSKLSVKARLFAGLQEKWPAMLSENAPWLRAALVDVVVMGLLVFTSLLPFLLTQLHENPAKLGFLRAAISFGTFACVWIFELETFKVHRQKIFAASLLTAALVVACLPSAPNFHCLVALCFCFGVCDGFSILYRDFLLFSVPQSSLGKASSLSQIFNSASEDLGEFRAGALASILGLSSAICVSAITAAAVSLYYAYSLKITEPPTSRNNRSLGDSVY